MEHSYVAISDISDDVFAEITDTLKVVSQCSVTDHSFMFATWALAAMVYSNNLAVWRQFLHYSMVTRRDIANLNVPDNRDSPYAFCFDIGDKRVVVVRGTDFVRLRDVNSRKDILTDMRAWAAWLPTIQNMPFTQQKRRSRYGHFGFMNSAVTLWNNNKMDTWLENSRHVVFIGHSMGAAIAANLASMYNYRLRKLNSDDSLAHASCSVVSCPPFLHPAHRREWQLLVPDHMHFWSKDDPVVTRVAGFTGDVNPFARNHFMELKTDSWDCILINGKRPKAVDIERGSPAHLDPRPGTTTRRGSLLANIGQYLPTLTTIPNIKAMCHSVFQIGNRICYSGYSRDSVKCTDAAISNEGASFGGGGGMKLSLDEYLLAAGSIYAAINVFDAYINESPAYIAKAQHTTPSKIQHALAKPMPLMANHAATLAFGGAPKTSPKTKHR